MMASTWHELAWEARLRKLDDLIATVPVAQPRPFGTAAMIEEAYRKRRCFICDRYGRCTHREPRVELAIMRAGEP